MSDWIQCDLKLLCGNDERSLRYLYAPSYAASNDEVHNYAQLHSYVCNEYKLKNFDLSRIHENKIQHLNGEVSLYNAAEEADKGVIHLNVTPSKKGGKDGKQVGYYARPVNTGDGKGKKKDNRKSKRFDAIAQKYEHPHECCYKECKIYGDLYEHKNSYSYSCKKCYNALSKDSKDEFIVHASPWANSVPKAPLSMERSNDESAVEHLQAILTSLGHMSPEDTSIRKGLFGTLTAHGVYRLREALNVYASDYYEYDRALADALHAHLKSK